MTPLGPWAVHRLADHTSWWPAGGVVTCIPPSPLPPRSLACGAPQAGKDVSAAPAAPLKRMTMVYKPAGPGALANSPALKKQAPPAAVCKDLEAAMEEQGASASAAAAATPPVASQPAWVRAAACAAAASASAAAAAAAPGALQPLPAAPIPQPAAHVPALPPCDAPARVRARLRTHRCGMAGAGARLGSGTFCSASWALWAGWSPPPRGCRAPCPSRTTTPVSGGQQCRVGGQHAAAGQRLAAGLQGSSTRGPQRVRRLAVAHARRGALPAGLPAAWRTHQAGGACRACVNSDMPAP